MAQAKTISGIGSGWHGESLRHRQARLFGKAKTLKAWNIDTYQDNPEISFQVVAPSKKVAMKALKYNWNKYGGLRNYPSEETDYMVGDAGSFPDESELKEDPEYKPEKEEIERYNRWIEEPNEDGEKYLKPKKTQYIDMEKPDELQFED